MNKPVVRKTVKAVDAEQDLTEAALVDLVEMVKFLNENRNYWASDYLAERQDTALGKLLSKNQK